VLDKPLGFFKLSKVSCGCGARFTQGAVAWKARGFDPVIKKLDRIQGRAAGIIAPLLALGIRELEAFHALAPKAICAYLGVSVLCSIWFFAWFQVARGLPSYFSIHDARRLFPSQTGEA
jgi:hypothetical protein